MQQDEFKQIAQYRMSRCLSIMEWKTQEYSSNEDALHNFKRAAEILKCTPEKALVGMMVKHLVSVLDLTEALSKNEAFSYTIFDEKITDLINYLILLDAITRERLESSK